MKAGLTCQTSLPGDHSERGPPDPIPNSAVKPLSANDSVAVCHAKVGNRQALIANPIQVKPSVGFFFGLAFMFNQSFKFCTIYHLS
jgi:hypothetical protein